MARGLPHPTQSTLRSTHLLDSHTRRVASPGSDTAGEGEEEEGDDDGRRHSATESDRDDPYSPGIGEEAGQEREVEMDVEADADEHEKSPFTWVRVSTAPPLCSTAAPSAAITSLSRPLCSSSFTPLTPCVSRCAPSATRQAVTPKAR